ncbi:MAG: SpoIIE family protein phosphatase, partial [Bacteroidota bacterium]
YLWGGAFIFILAATTFLFTDFITGFDSGGMGMILLFVSPYFLVQFIYSLFNFQLPKWAKLSLIILSIFLVCFVIMIILEIKFLENLLNNDEGGISILIPTILLFSLSSTFVFIGIFKAIKQKQNNAWTLFIGLIAIIALTIFAVIENFFTDSFVSGTNWYKVLHILPMPLSVLIAIVRDYVASNKNLKFQLSKVEELTAQTLKEQQEKQEILSKQNEVLEVQVTERTKEINEQKNLLQEKQKEILDSIGYAKRLQSAILPPESFIQQHVEDYFILYKPKDIVAGDFYWAEKIDHLFFIAAADSTGHGVPGAMVSVVCSSALNRSVKEFYLKETGKILDKARELVIETFEKSNADIKDGMDISLLCIDSKNNKIFWSGANNPLWHIQENQLKEITADKQPIGKVENIKPFTTHGINYRKGSIFYLFTDGYADQFGGPKGKKFKHKQLQELLLNTQNLAMENQLTAIENRFNEWTGSLEQVDDVCILGLKI